MRRKLIRKYIMLLVTLSGMMALLLACTNANIYQKKGEQRSAIGEYYQASLYYKKSYARTSAKDKQKRGERASLMGTAFSHIGYSQKAIAALQNAVRYNAKDTTAVFLLARQQLKSGLYKLAAQNFQTYLSYFGDSIPEKYVGNVQLARVGLESCKVAPEWKEHPNLEYTVVKDAILNSRRSDYKPMFVGEESDVVVISTTRSETTGDDVSNVTGIKYGDLFQSKKNEQGVWQKPEMIEGGVNTEYDEGASCLSADGKKMYFTRCSHDPAYPRYAEIYESTRSDASWGSPKKSEIMKDTLSSFAHPAASPDGKYLYFVSDAPGGMGGLDIWRTTITGEGFAGAEPLGPPINTPGDEVFPVFRPNGDLYFSSDGHVGMGGLDILIAHPDTIREDSMSWKIENPQFPLNSFGDDLGPTFDDIHNRGFFSSSRGDGKGWEHIYQFECKEILYTVTGWVYEKDGYELTDALVYMVGNDGTNEKLSVLGDGSFTKVIKPDVDYIFLGTCKGYLNVANAVRVDKHEEGLDTTIQFPLPPINVPVLIDNIFYEFDRAEITPESATAIDTLVAMMNQNPNITIELSAHCDYRGNDDYNERLSQRRAESVVNYMIEHGIAAERLTPKGYGESVPKVISKKMYDTYQKKGEHKFLNQGDTLTEAFIMQQKPEEQEYLNSLNRRTEFKVLRTTYGTTLQELRSTLYKEEEEEENSMDR